MEDHRKVSFEEAIRLAKKLNLAAVFETSAKSNQSIDDVFYRSMINCVDNNYDSFYQDNRMTQLPIKVVLSPHKLNKRYLDTVRLYVQPVAEFNATLFERRLKKGRWISYNNEMSALALLLFTFNKGESVSKLNSVSLTLN